jgi:hypothetical protein
LTFQGAHLITDILLRRYPEPWIYADNVPPKVALLIRQAAIVFFDDIASKMPNRTRLFEVPEKRLARELGVVALGRQLSSERRTMDYLGEQYDLWNDSHENPDTFFKLRLSLLELLFREAEATLQDYAPKKDVASWWALLQKRTFPSNNNVENALQVTMHGILELNTRFKDAGLPFEYHNGLIQRIDDERTAEEIERPFWQLVSDPKFANIDADIKEAIDRRDTGKSDAAFHALRALESTIKIVSNNLGRTRNTEKGASEFIDNLVSSKHGRYIATWEADALKALFRELRNPLGHGPGDSQHMTLSHEQSTWAIEVSMSWIKSLLRRVK